MPTEACVNCDTPLLPEQSDFLGSHSQNSDCVAGLKLRVTELEREVEHLRMYWRPGLEE